MDDTYTERVSGIRQRYGDAMERLGRLSDTWNRRDFMDWLDYRHVLDTRTLNAFDDAAQQPRHD